MRNSSLTLSAVFAGALLLGIFNSPANGETHASHSGNSANILPAPASFKAELGKVYDGYLHIQQALAADDFQKAKDAFGVMHGVLHGLTTEGMDSATLKYWKTSDVRFMEALHPMAASKDIQVLRIHFADFTPMLVDVIEKIGTTVRIQFTFSIAPCSKSQMEGTGSKGIKTSPTLISENPC